MHVRLAALAAWLLLSAAATPATAEELMTLDDAFARVAQTHPELRLVDARATVLAAERDQAVQRPPWTLGAEVENALGTGAARGLDSAELTLSLSSVLERGGKLDARRTLAQSRIDALAVQRETGRLDLLAETAQRYLAVVGADRQRSLANMDVGQRQRTVAAARQRLQAGRPRFNADASQHRQLLARFMDASQRGDSEAIQALLHTNALLVSDGGGVVTAAVRPLLGAERIGRLFWAIARRGAVHPAQLGYVNGEPAILRFVGDRLHSVTTIEVVDGRIANVYSVLNPEKLPKVVTRGDAAASW